jgi:outer membrane protein OmpA-like peptidoglycan-associated protein
MLSKRIRSSGVSHGLAVAAAVALVLSAIAMETNPALGSGSAVAEVVNVDFTTATQSGLTIANPASGKIADLTVSGSPTGLTTAAGLQFANGSGSRNQYLTGNLGTTTNMSQIVIEFEGRFPDAGCNPYNAGSMVFSLGSSSSSYVNYNIYRHSGFIGFNTFNSEIFGIALPSTTSFHRYKFLMVPNSQSRTNQRIWVDDVEQSLAFRNSASESAGCSALNGGSEQSSGRVFSSGTYSDGRFMFMTHAVGATTWSTNGTIKNLKITTTTVTPATVPGAPTISAITGGDGQLSVAFSAPGSSGGSDISNYEYSTNDGTNWVALSTPSTSSPLVISGLDNGTTYPVKIRAVNIVGAGTASSAVSGTPAAASPPPAPPSSSSGSAPPPIPPTTKVSAITVKQSNSSKGSMLTLKLNEPPAGSEKVFVVVRLLDLNGKLIQELNIPVTSTTSTLEVPVNLPIGTFTVSAGASNSLASSQSMNLQADIVKKAWLASTSPEGTLRLAGKAASDPVAFSPNSVLLSKQAKIQLRQAARIAKRTNSRVAVTGFAANSGMGTVFEKNIAERRALAVTRFLKAQGVSSWLFYSGFDGAKSADFSGQPRRVEIRILK